MMIELELYSLVPGHSQGSYSVILAEKDGKRKIPVMIGGFEAQAIAIELEKTKPTRPLTHDLFASFMRLFQIELNRVEINKLEEGVFYASLICKQADGQIKELDSRTSDAIAMAVRFECPIFAEESVVESAGFIPDEEEADEAGPARSAGDDAPPAPKTWSENLGSLSNEELDSLLEDALREEDYHKAAGIRDEINRRKK
jgi:uncharacterized protein